MSAANLTQHAASFSCMSAAKGDPELDRSWLPLIVPGLLVGYFMWRLTRRDDPAVDDLVPLTPATEDVIVLNRQCSRNSDILHEREREHITLSHDEGEASASRLFPRRVMSTLRLPLNACSAAAADAIEKCDRRAFPAEFDLAVSGGGLIAFYGGAVSSVLGTLARRGVLRVGRLHGVSSGSLVCATYLGVESGFTEMEDVYRCYQLFARSRTALGLSAAMRQFLDECLPPDIHERASGRMHVTVTELAPERWYWPRRRVISSFASRDDFLDAVMASTIIPGLTSPHPHQPKGRPGCFWLDGAIVKMPLLSSIWSAKGKGPPSSSDSQAHGRRPYLKLNQLSQLLRLRYWPLWILLQRDHDFDTSLVLPAFKDIVRLLVTGERLPWGAMAFSPSSAFPL